MMPSLVIHGSSQQVPGFFRNRMFLQPPNQRQWQQKPADSNEIFVGECGQNRFILVAYETYDMYIHTYNHIMLHIYIICVGIIFDHIKEFHEFPVLGLQINKNPPFCPFRPFFSPSFFFDPIHRPIDRPLIGAFFINKKFSGFRSR